MGAETKGHSVRTARRAGGVRPDSRAMTISARLDQTSISSSFTRQGTYLVRQPESRLGTFLDAAIRRTDWLTRNTYPISKLFLLSDHTCVEPKHWFARLLQQPVKGNATLR